MMTAFGISDIGDQGRSYARDKTSWSLDGGLFSCMPQTLKGKFRWRQHSVVRESGRSHRWRGRNSWGQVSMPTKSWCDPVFCL